MAKNTKVSNYSDWADATIVKEKTSRLSSIVVFMLCFIPIFACLAFGAVSTGVLGVVAIFTGIMLIFLFADAWKSKEFRFNTNLLQIPFLGLILIGIIQLLPLWNYNISNDLLSIPASGSLSLDPTSTTFAVAKLGIYFVFFATALTYINNQKRLRIVVFTIIIFASLMAFLGILQRLASPEFIYGIREIKHANPFASYVNQHHFAAFMEMSLGLTLGLLFGKATEKDKRLLLIIAVVLMGIAIILTGSRGGFLSLIGVIGFLVLINIFYKEKDVSTENSNQFSLKQSLPLIGSSVLLVLVLLGAVIWLGSGDSISRIAGQSNQVDFTNGRVHFWTTSLQIFRDNPIFGVGLEAFGVAFTKYDTWNGNLRVEQAHNDYLQMLVDAGILGFICTIAFVILFFKNSLNLIRTTKNRFRRNVAIGSLAGCFGIVIHSFFDFPLRTNANTFFFLLLVALATVTIKYPKLYRQKPS